MEGACRDPGAGAVAGAVDRLAAAGEDAVRRRAKVDANHADIVQALRSVGWYVIDLARAGSGVPDLLCVRRGMVQLVEVKDGSKKPSARRLTLAQIELHEDCRSAGVPVVIVSSVAEALELS